MKTAHAIGLILGLALGLAASFAPSVLAARNGSGTYSLPNTGSIPNPVVTGTTITSAWANGTLSDISTELTSSLDRQGRGAMLAPLQLVSGNAGAPGLTFSSEATSGLYRAGANDIRLSIDSTAVQQWTDVENKVTADATITGLGSNASALTVNGTGGQAGLAVTAGTGNGVTSTGVGNGWGGSFAGGVDGGGAIVTGGGAGRGIEAYGGNKTGTGVYAQGGSAAGLEGGTGVRGVGGAGGGNGGAGGLFYAGAGEAVGVFGIGSGTGAGGYFTAGTSSTGATRTSAATVSGGDIVFLSNTAPTVTTALTNRLTASAIPKAWGVVDDGVTTPVLTAGMNVASISCTTATTTVTFASAMADANYVVMLSTGFSETICHSTAKTTGSFGVICYDESLAGEHLYSPLLDTGL